MDISSGNEFPLRVAGLYRVSIASMRSLVVGHHEWLGVGCLLGEVFRAQPTGRSPQCSLRTR